MNVRLISINDIGLSPRSSNALHRAGVDTVGQMLDHTEKSLTEIRNLGRKSVDEILQKIEEYKEYEREGIMPILEGTMQEVLPDVPEDFSSWAKTEEGQTFILSWLKENDVKINTLDLLSAKAYNHLLLNGYTDIHQIAFMSADDLMQIPRMDLQCAEEIVGRCRHFLDEKKDLILKSLQEKKEATNNIGDELLRNMIHSEEYHDKILMFVQANDAEVEKLDFSNRAKKFLQRQGYFKISDLIFLTKKELWDIPQMGAKTVDEIFRYIDGWIEKNAVRIKAVLGGDDSVLFDDTAVVGIVDEAFNRIGFGGYSLQELRDKAGITKQISDEQLKRVLGSMIAEGKLEYVDFRCYRVYPKFEDYMMTCSEVDDRTKQAIIRKLDGDTLEIIAGDYGLTRERVRQIINSGIRKVQNIYQTQTGMKQFDEDYYRYCFETYAFDKKDAEEWLGVSRRVYNYLELTGSKRGTKTLEEALDDYHNMDLGFRLRIKNYLNRNRLFLDGRWINRNRADLEEYAVRKYCTENVSFDEFIDIYNGFLEREEVPYDEKIYYTDAVLRTRKNHLPEARFLLWKQHEMMRYYDIDGQDFTELLDALNLESYEDIEYSTLKFVRDYPEIMERYDIRDQYELHNLLRKIVADGSYHDFHCEKMPMIRFGTFDRDGALLDLLIDSAPVSQTDFAELVSQEYGYDPATVIGTYLQPLAAYYHQGIYRIDQKAMLSENQKKLLDKMDDDFYYMDEIRRLYASLVPDADMEEINPYNLKLMGFSVLSRYVFRNHNNLYDYFHDILTKEDITDITPYRRRFAYIASFSGTLVSMKNDLEILELEPNKIVTFRKLAAGGVTKEDLQAFCDQVADFVEYDTCFSVQSIKKEGFNAELFDLGFTDWFYASLLSSDDRFSYTKAFGNIILTKGAEHISIQSFEEQLIKEHGSIDVFDLMTEMEETYGCRIADRLDIIYKVKETDIYYDAFLDRLYANVGVFNRELDATEGM